MCDKAVRDKRRGEARRRRQGKERRTGYRTKSKNPTQTREGKHPNHHTVRLHAGPGGGQ